MNYVAVRSKGRDPVPHGDYRTHSQEEVRLSIFQRCLDVLAKN